MTMNEQFLRQQLAITEQQRNAAMSAAAQASAAVDLANTTIKRLQERIEKLETAASSLAGVASGDAGHTAAATLQ